MKKTIIIVAVIFGLSSFSFGADVVVIPLLGNAGKAYVEKTGQTNSYLAGDDGDLQKGLDLPTPRFTDNGNGTITDNLTGLIWLKNFNCFNERTWVEALSDCNGLASGSCGLTDGSVAGGWRLPNRKELLSLMDLGKHSPPLPAGHPFDNFQERAYWSSTPWAKTDSSAWSVGFGYGYVDSDLKTDDNFVSAVRGGQ